MNKEKDTDNMSHYTIFNPKNVVETNPEKLQELADALGQTDLHTLVLFTVERSAYQWTIAYSHAMLRLQIGDDDDFRRKIERVFNDYVLPSLELRIEELRRVESRLRLFSEHIVAQFAEGSVPSKDGTLLARKYYPEEHAGFPLKSIEQAEKEAYDIYRSITDNTSYNPTESGLFNDKNQAIRQRIDDTLRGDLRDALTQELVAASIVRAINDKVVTALTPKSNHDRESAIVFGGIGSGKSTTATRFADALVGDGEHPDDQLFFSIDRCRPLLIDEQSSKLPFNEKETAHELLIITSMFYRVMRKLVEIGQAPVCIFERERPESFEIALGGGGKANLYLITIDPEKALERANSRANTQENDPRYQSNAGRTFAADFILETHQYASRKTIDLLLENIDRNVTFEILDNSLDDAIPRTIAFGDLQKREMIVCDLEALMALIQRAETAMKMEAGLVLEKFNRHGLTLSMVNEPAHRNGARHVTLGVRS